VPRPSNVVAHVPDGFAVELVTGNIHAPRVIRTTPNGDLFVADSLDNAVHVLRIPHGTAKPTTDEVFVRGCISRSESRFIRPGLTRNGSTLRMVLFGFPTKTVTLNLPAMRKTLLEGFRLFIIGRATLYSRLMDRGCSIR
jgi:hypothetical protein